MLYASSNKIKEVNMKKNFWIFTYSLLFGLIIWITDAVVNYFYLGGKLSMPELILTNIPENLLVYRTVILLITVGFGLAIYKLLRNKNSYLEEIKHNKESYKNIVANSNEGITIIEHTGRVIDWNREQEKITGITRESAIGKDYWQLQNSLIPGNEGSAIADLIRKQAGDILKNGNGVNKTLHANFVIKHKDGGDRYIDHYIYRMPKNGDNLLCCVLHDQTDYNEALIKKNESEKKFHEIFTLCPDPIFIIRVSDRKIIEINRSFEESVSFIDDEFTDGDDFRCFYFGSESELKKYLDEVKSAGRVSNYEIISNRNGQKSAHIFSATLINVNGEECVITYVKDITDRKIREDELQKIKVDLESMVRERTVELETINEVLTQENIERIKIEEALRESESNYRTLINMIPVGVYRTTVDGRFLQANPAMAIILGLDTPEDLEKVSVFDFFIDEKDRHNLVEKQKQTGNIVHAETKLLRADGRIIWVKDIGRVSFSTEGRVEFITGTIEDITERKQAQEAMNISEERYRLLFENLHDIYFRLNDNREIALISPSATNVLGYSREELTGMPLEMLIQGKDIITVFLEKISRSGRINNFIMSVVNKSGSRLHLSIDAHVHLDRETNKRVVEGIARDITNDVRYQNLLTTLYHISQALNSSDTLADLYKSIHEALNNIIDSMNFFIAIYDKENSKVNFPYSIDEYDMDTSTRSIDDKFTLSARVIKSGEPLLKYRDELIDFYDGSEMKKIPLIWLGLPLKIKDDVIGAIVFQSYTDEKIFTGEDIPLLYPVADQIAHAIVRKKSSLELDFQLRFLQNMIDTIPNPVYYKDSVRKIYQGCNRAFTEMIGKEKTDIIGRTVYEIFPGELADTYDYHDQELLYSGGVQKYQTKVRHSDGKLHDSVIYKSCYYDIEGNKAGIVGVILDITEMKNAEKELRDAREYAELIYNLTPSCIFTFDKDLNVTSWNERIARLTGYKAEEVLGKKCVLYDQDDEDQKLIFNKAIRTPVIGKESNITTKKGSRRIISKNIDLLRNSDGEIIGGIESFEDITGRKRIEEALYWQAGVNSAIAELSKAIMLIPDLNEIASMILEHSLRLTGSRTGFIGYLDPKKGYMNVAAVSLDIKMYSDFDVTAESFHEYAGTWGWVLRNKKAIVVNSPATDPRSYDSSLWNIMLKRIIAAPTMSGNRLVGVVMLANAESDYSDKENEIVERMSSLFAVALQRIRAEEEIRSALGKEQELNELKSRFISMVSHEYRTPLTAIILATELLSDYEDKLTPENKIQHFDRIKQAVKTMNSLLDDIISYNKAELGKTEFNPQYIDVEKLALSITHEVELIAGRKCMLDLTINNGGVLGNIDEKLVRKIVTNLLTNAVKYSHDNSTVEFTVNIKRNEVEFIIRDYGIGMNQETKRRIFEPFFRGRNVGSRSGTGLGLAVVKNSVDLHKGKIYYDSEENKGTTFVVTIPYHENSSLSKSMLKK